MPPSMLEMWKSDCSHLKIHTAILFSAMLIIFLNGTLRGQTVRLEYLMDPVLFHGDEDTAFRDPAVLFHQDTFHLFFTLVEIEPDDSIFSYTAYSKSDDLLNWTNPIKITPRDQKLNYCSPGNVIRHNDEWILCLQTYPRSGYVRDQQPRYGDQTARIFTMRSWDLVEWGEPELLRVKGDEVHVEAMGRMIDPYLVEDKDEPGKWWCFYKQRGVSMSYSNDLVHWTFYGHTQSGENVCVLVENDEYLLFHSPHNGIGMKRSKKLDHWTDWGDLLTFGQDQWDWAKGRITAGAVIDMKDHDLEGRYLMFFHGSGPLSEQERHFDMNASIGIAWSNDLIHWSWPEEKY